jgi:UDP-N-acetylglucosamine 2-epimerase
MKFLIEINLTHIIINFKNIMKKKIITILGTRPEIIRLSCIIKQLDKNFNHILINTNQNHNKNLNSIFFKELNIKKPKYIFNNITNKSPIDFLSKLLINVDKILNYENPDGILILGDTNSSLSAICGKKRKIPIFHIEAGNRCFDERVPEEINRKIVDHISDINMTYSDYAKLNLISEGIKNEKIIKIGSPLFEVYNEYDNSIEKSSILKKLKLKKKNFFLVSVHREENVDQFKNLSAIINSLKILIKKFNLPIIFSTHPRTRSRLKKIKNLNKKIIFSKPFSFYDYIKLMKNCKLILSDSGSITEETSILKIPSVNLRFTFERQEGLERGLSSLSGLKSKDIIESVDFNLSKKVFDEHPDYSITNVSGNVSNIIQSYIQYVNYKVWYK